MATPLAEKNVLDLEMHAAHSRFLLGSKLTCYIANYIMMSKHFHLLGYKQRKLRFSSKRVIRID